MSGAHTQGRLKLFTVYAHPEIRTADDEFVTAFQPTEKSMADAIRLVACWNACEGVPLEMLDGARVTSLVRDGNSVRRVDYLEVLTIERSTLLTALKALVINQDETWRRAGFTETQIETMPYLQPARDAIKMVEAQ